MRLKFLTVRSLCAAFLGIFGPVVYGKDSSGWKPNVAQRAIVVELDTMSVEAKLVKLYRDGRYAECIKLAAPLEKKNKGASLAKDVLTFHLGASYYHTSDFGNAIRVLRRHVASYGIYSANKSTYFIDAEYMLASAYTYGGRHLKGEKALRIFLENNNGDADAYVPFALYDWAYSNAQLGAYGTAMEGLSQILENHKQSSVLPVALALYGNVLQRENRSSESETYYRRALTEARKMKDAKAEQVSLESLIGLYSFIKKPDHVQSEKFAKDYDGYFAKFGDAASRCLVAANGVAVLRDVGRAEEALQRLLQILHKEEIRGNEGHIARCMHIGFRNFRNAKGEVLVLGSVLSEALAGLSPSIEYTVIARTEALEAICSSVRMRGILPPGKEKKVRSLIAGHIDELTNVDRSSLSPRMLVVCGVRLCGVSKEPDRQCPRIGYHFLADALRRLEGKSDEEAVALVKKARWGIVELAVKRPEDEQVVAVAVGFLDDALKKPEESRAYRRALEAKLEILHHTGEHERAIEVGEELLESGECYSNVWFQLGMSYRALGKRDEAISKLRTVISEFKIRLRCSVPACKTVMMLKWERNQVKGGKKDRQAAYELGRDFYTSLEELVKENSHRIPVQDRKGFEAVKQLYLQYRASGEVNP